MTVFRATLAGLLAVPAVVLQAGVVARLSLPYVRPDVVLVLVVAVALAAGPDAGAAVGFGAGLLTDALGDHPFGVVALVLCLVGYAAGLGHPRRRLPARLAVVAAATIAAGAGLAVAMAAAGRAPMDRAALGASLPAGVAGNVILAVLVVPAADLLCRRR